MKEWFKSGSPWIWLSASTVSLSLIMVVGLIGLIAVRGLGIYWPGTVTQYDLRGGGNTPNIVIGELYDSEQVSRQRLLDAGMDVQSDADFIPRYLIKTGNRELFGLDFRWITDDQILRESIPENIVVFERREWGNLYGFIQSVKQNGEIIQEQDKWEVLNSRLQRALHLHDEIQQIEKHEIGAINYDLERLRLKEKELQLENKLTPANEQELAEQRALLQGQYEELQAQLNGLYEEIKRDSVTVKISDERVVEESLANIVRIHQPNAMHLGEKVAFYIKSVWLFVSEEPREANTEGGIFPAIFGTVMMVIIMSIIVTPFGIVAAVYLREYAKQNALTRTVRIAVNNLAGVPSIVYGVFGLGFFVYFLGGSIDQLFFPEALPAPTFGTPGILWASLTLAILTVPVVIVATEEGLSRIPKSIREGSLALGATKWETLWKTILPMASPAMMTGLILAVARAAGEVAPLMLVGVVKLAPTLPLDENFPFLHLDRKFMHLGFHIYDVGFQSPNVEAARPLVYATAFLLICVIILLNLAAIAVRNHLREKFKGLDH